MNKVRDLICEEDVKEWSEYGTLGHTISDSLWWRKTSINHDKLSSVGKVAIHPGESLVIKSIELKFPQEYGVVHHVKSS